MSWALRTDSLSRRFGGLNAVSDVSLEIEEGTVTGVIGPNGAGKTTLINLVTGHLRPTAGSVSVLGHDVTGARPWDVARLGVARTFQVGKPFRDMSVGENVGIGAMFGAHPAGSRQAALDRADQVLARVGLAERASALPLEVPVADLRRLELARALAMEPKLLLLDEVMAGLRPEEVKAAVSLIRSLKDEGITVVAVEHVMQAIMAMCDRVVVLHEGRVLSEGTPEEISGDEKVIGAYLGRRYAERMRGTKGA